MKKSLSITLSSFLTISLFSGCESTSPDEIQVQTPNTVQINSDTTSVSDGIDNSIIAKRANKIKIALASQVTSQRALNQNTSMADVLFMLSDTRDTLDELSIKTHALYDYFKENFVDTDALSDEDLNTFNNLSVEEFNRFFINDYFGVQISYGENRHLNAYEYLKNQLNTEAKSSIEDNFYSIILDYPRMVEEFTVATIYSKDDKDSYNNNPFKDSFYNARLNNPQIESKIRTLLESSPYIADKLFSRVFNEAHVKYHRAHIDSDMYSAMVDALLIVQDSTSASYKGIAYSLYSKDTLTLPNSENASAFSKEFFNIGDTSRGDGNELTTEKLILLWSATGITSPFDAIGFEYTTVASDNNSSNSDEINYKASEVELAYLDFLYLGIVPDAKEADSDQANYFAFAREAGLNLKTSLLEVKAAENSAVQRTDSLDFVQNYSLPLYSLIDKVANTRRIYEKVSYDRMLSYMFQYIKSSYAFYVNEESNNKAEIQEHVTKTLSTIIDTYEYNSYEANAKERSGGIDLELIYIGFFELYDKFANLSLFDQMNFFVDYLFFDVNASEYVDITQNNSLLTNQYDLNISQFVKEANDTWLYPLSNTNYSDIKLYNSDLRWQYIPSNLSNLKYLVQNSESKEFEYNFTFDSGYLYIYFVSTESTSQMQSYGYPLKRIITDRILSSKEDEIYKLYRMKIYAKYKETYNFSTLFEHSEAIFFDTSDVYIPKTAETLAEDKAKADQEAQNIADGDTIITVQ